MRKLLQEIRTMYQYDVQFFFRRGAKKEVQEETSEETSRIGDAIESKTQSIITTDKHPLPVQVLHHRYHLVDTERCQILDRN